MHGDEEYRTYVEYREDNKMMIVEGVKNDACMVVTNTVRYEPQKKKFYP
jgi:hypothetical protein